MLVFDIPSRSSGAPLRGGALGSCRVRDPFEALIKRGELPLVASGLHKSYTAREALMLLDVVAGRAAIEDFVLPLRFSNGKLPSPKNLAESLEYNLDVVILEISSFNQFFYHDTPIHNVLLTERLVQPNAKALLKWYRQVCSRGSAGERCVQASLDALREGGADADHMEDLLRGIRLERQGVDRIEQSLRTMMSRLGGLWILVGPFVVSEETGDMMTERRALIDALDTVAERCAVSRWDPALLISAFGRQAVLSANGRNLYHYAKTFQPTAANALLDVMRETAGRKGKAA